MPRSPDLSLKPSPATPCGRRPGDAGAPVSEARRLRSARAPGFAAPPRPYPSDLEKQAKTASGNRLRSGDRRPSRLRADPVEPPTDPRP